MKRFHLVVNAAGQGTLFDKDAGVPIDNVRAVSVIARHGQPTRVVVEFLAVDVEVEAEAADLEESKP